MRHGVGVGLRVRVRAGVGVRVRVRVRVRAAFFNPVQHMLPKRRVMLDP